MEFNVHTEVSELCRVCFNTVPAEVSIDIYTTPSNPDSVNLQGMLSAICPILVFSDENIVESEALHRMPRKVCPDCKRRVEAAYDLNRQCIETDRKLWEMIAIKQELLQGPDDDPMGDPLQDADQNPGTSSSAECKQEPELLIECTDIAMVETEQPNSSDEMGKPKRPRSTKSKIEKIADKSCKICLNVFKSMREAKAHLKTAHSDMSERLANRTCSICSSVFRSIPARKAHMLEAHKDNLEKIAGQTCSMCCKTFDTSSELKAHMAEIHGEGGKRIASKICKFCPISNLRSVVDLKKHLAECHPEKVHRCDICQAVFHERKPYDEHMLGHVNVKKIHVCEICHKSFTSYTGLRYHQATHNEDKLLKCGECGKGFPHKSALKVHMIYHKGERKYTCPKCPSTFFTKGDVKTHMLTHTQVRDHICDICGSSFMANNALKSHVATVHAVERAFKCGTCGSTFTRQAHLSRHILTHTGEKPYKCPYCDRAYAQSNDLVKHSKTHVGANPFFCDLCDASFRLLTELRHHYKVHFQEGDQVDHLRFDHTFTAGNILRRRFAKEQQTIENGEG